MRNNEQDLGVDKQQAGEKTGKKLSPMQIKILSAFGAVGLAAAGALYPLQPANASVFTGENRGAITVENGDDGAERATEAGAGPKPETAGVEASSLETTAPSTPAFGVEAAGVVTETVGLANTETIKPLTVTVTALVTGSIELNGKVVGKLTAGQTVTSPYGIFLEDDGSVTIPLDGKRIAVIPASKNGALANIEIDGGGKPTEFQVVQEARPIGSATVIVSELNVREKKDADATVLGKLKNGDRLIILEILKDEDTGDIRYKIVVDINGVPTEGFVASKVGSDIFTTPFVPTEIPKEFGTGGSLEQEFEWLSEWWKKVKDFFNWNDETEELVMGSDGTPVAVATKSTGQLVARITEQPATTPSTPGAVAPPEGRTFVVMPVAKIENRSEYEIPSWYQGVETNLRVKNGEFILSDEVESSGYFLQQLKRVLADQQGISVEDLDRALEQSGGITTLDLVLRGTNNPEQLQGIYPPTLRRGDSVKLDLTEIHIETSDDPLTLPKDAKFGSYFETAQDATAGQGKPDWVAYYIDENDQLHVVLNKTMLESMTETSRETFFSRQQVKDRVAKFEVTEDQYWKDVNNQKGGGPAQRFTQALEVLGRYKYLPEDQTSEPYDPQNPGGAQLKYLLWNNAPAGQQGTAMFPLTDRENLVVSYDEGESPTDIPGYYEKDYRLTFSRN